MWVLYIFGGPGRPVSVVCCAVFCLYYCNMWQAASLEIAGAANFLQEPQYCCLVAGSCMLRIHAGVLEGGVAGRGSNH